MLEKQLMRYSRMGSQEDKGIHRRGAENAEQEEERKTLRPSAFSAPLR